MSTEFPIGVSRNNPLVKSVFSSESNEGIVQPGEGRILVDQDGNLLTDQLGRLLTDAP